MKIACFSILAPGKHIPEHRSLYKGLIRYHLEFKIPQPNTQCGIKVNGETRHWEGGKSLFLTIRIYTKPGSSVSKRLNE